MLCLSGFELYSRWVPLKNSMISVCNIDILTNLSYISEMVECPFNCFVDMKRHRYGVIENDADITRLICRLDDIISQVEGSRGGSLNLE